MICDKYRPQRSWRKVIFSQASVILSTGRGRCLLGGLCLLPGGGSAPRGVPAPGGPAPGGPAPGEICSGGDLV